MKPEDLHYYQSKLLPHKLELTLDSVITYCQSAAFPTRSLKIECLRGTLPDYRDEDNGEAPKLSVMQPLSVCAASLCPESEGSSPVYINDRFS
jgi:hypothetical protein